MKRTLTLLMATAMLLAGASIGLAQDAKTVEKADTPTPAQLRVQMHRAMADLIEARAAEKPDEAKVEKLADTVQYLRGKIQAQGTAPGWYGQRGNGYGQQCPWGGPGNGPRMGRGYGPGKGYNAQGQGRGGQGRGMGPGMGRGKGGQGRGMGPGMGREKGGQGRGMGPGMGRGKGGQGRGMGPGMGRGMAAGQGRGMGRQWDYVDKNQDGIRDYAQPPVPAKSAKAEK